MSRATVAAGSEVGLNVSAHHTSGEQASLTCTAGIFNRERQQYRFLDRL